MFTVRLGLCRNGKCLPFRLRIEGCPGYGIAAIDFRRAHGLPEAPSNEIEVPGFDWQDEEFVRANAGRADGDANINYEYRGGRQIHHSVNAVGEVCKTEFYASNNHSLYATPESIFTYLSEQHPKTGRHLYLDLWDHEARSLERCRQELLESAQKTQREEETKEAARHLLKGELDGLKSSLEKAIKEAAYWQKEAERLQEEVEA